MTKETDAAPRSADKAANKKTLDKPVLKAVPGPDPQAGFKAPDVAAPEAKPATKDIAAPEAPASGTFGANAADQDSAAPELLRDPPVLAVPAGSATAIPPTPPAPKAPAKRLGWMQREGRAPGDQGSLTLGHAIGAQPAATAQPEATVQPAGPATMHRRHWGLLFTFVVLVLAPLGAIIFYLFTIAEDQYASTTGFTVRTEESGGASDFMGGLAQFALGGGNTSDGDILYEFIQSQELIMAVNDRIDLRAHYGQHWPTDWAFSIWDDASIEELLWFWQRIVRISYDQSTGLMEVRVLAFDPETARRIAQEIVRDSQDMINALNNQAREDAMSYAQGDLDVAVERLKQTREALTQFRTRTQIVDPEADIQGRMGVMNNLQQQLAESLIEYDLLQETANQNDPRVTQALRRIEVIRARIVSERDTFASDTTETGGVGEDYPTLIAEFESLSVDRQYAEQSYRAALTALDVARTKAARQSRYLATYIRPTLPQTSEFPRRYVLSMLAALFLVLFWSILALVYYSIRDRS